MSPIVMRPIGVVRSTRAAPTDDGWGAEAARIELDTARFGPDALLGLDAFSHAEVVFLFDRVDEAGVATGARHPRGNAAWPRVGIFAQRGKDRPNRIGLTICRVLRIEGTVLHVAGLDAIDGTPVLDLKPWMAGFAPRGAVREPGWADELMRGYW
ncbi:SAM-dependent methyltransferase [Elioraea tepidiphila]|uniref:SAM-dependent methyltransferase n=1 Tax=Elioraea tepidiphila TaxID=457934 RepID=UPI002FDA0047